MLLKIKTDFLVITLIVILGFTFVLKKYTTIIIWSFEISFASPLR